jgi:hypothetical protein
MEKGPNLGELISDSEQRRDAVHIAVASVTANELLQPGQHVGLQAPGVHEGVGPCEKNIGIVDPFLKGPVEVGQRFWLFIYPGTITALRHVWSHPLFTAAPLADHGHRWLALLAENENDADTRKAYAEWLDAHGGHEEAERQRKWTAAKQWLFDLCDKDPDGYWTLSYEQLMEAADEAWTRGEKYNWCVDCKADMGLCDSLREQRQEFWLNWSIVTGHRLPESLLTKATFGCSC